MLAAIALAIPIQLWQHSITRLQGAASLAPADGARSPRSSRFPGDSAADVTIGSRERRPTPTSRRCCSGAKSTRGGGVRDVTSQSRLAGDREAIDTQADLEYSGPWPASNGSPRDGRSTAPRGLGSRRSSRRAAAAIGGSCGSAAGCCDTPGRRRPNRVPLHNEQTCRGSGDGLRIPRR